MKKYLFFLFAIMILACGSSSVNTNESANAGNSVAGNMDNEKSSGTAKGACGSNIVFKKGTVILTSNFDGDGNELAIQTTTVTKVYQEGGMTLSDLEMKSPGENGEGEKTVNATYKCDGKVLYVDMSNFMPASEKNSEIKTSGMQFPFVISVGEKLPDFEYSIEMTTAGKTKKITSSIKNRNVEAKEQVTTAGGTFDCYKITSEVETDMNMGEMDEASKKIMEQVKKQMGKTIMTFWYAPDVTIIKMELSMGNKLMARSEVSGIK